MLFANKSFISRLFGRIQPDADREVCAAQAGKQLIDFEIVFFYPITGFIGNAVLDRRTFLF